ncbi:MAG: heme ABC exporter ATP-binding protein CcmA [Hyphomicrobium sp.]
MIIHAENLTILRGQRTIIKGLSLIAKSGEPLLLTGPNGAGKTTLIRTLAGFLAPEAGRIVLEGGNPERSTGEQCHYVGHLSGIKASLTALENLSFWAEYLAGDTPASVRRDAVETALMQFHLEPLADIPAGLLSAGQKRRLGLARLLVASRPVWLLDEPTVSLDVASTDMLSRLIGEHLRGAGIVIAATHLPLGLEGATYLRLGGGTAEEL